MLCYALFKHHERVLPDEENKQLMENVKKCVTKVKSDIQFDLSLLRNLNNGINICAYRHFHFRDTLCPIARAFFKREMSNTHKSFKSRYLIIYECIYEHIAREYNYFNILRYTRQVCNSDAEAAGKQ